jgi:RND superfamily putative drug exporter
VSAGQLDVQTAIVSHQWLVLGVMGLTIFVILLLLMRSLLIPLKAVVMNLLSLAVALGILTAIFQHGLLSGWFSHNVPGHVYTLVPPLLVGLVFGLSMDYEVFLLSRIRERWLATNDPERAIAEGLEASASAISGAALVLVCAFAVFVGVGIPTIKELGTGAAIAVAVDVTVVRLVIVPAAMTLMARWNWWLPGPLARLTPPTSPSTAPEAATVV